MRALETSLPGVLILEPAVFADARGFFFESYHERRLADVGITDRFVQDNHSGSVRGTLRGLHYQLTKSQAKICRVTLGEVFDVSVDVRRGSPSFGKWTGVTLSAENRRQVYIPPGFAHGFLVLSERAEFLYKCSDFYDASDERGIAWNDPEIGIEWPLTGPPILSAKDQQHRRLAEVPPQDLPIFKG